MQQHFQLFEAYLKSKASFFFKRNVKHLSLLSLNTVGSMNCESVAKSMKNKILTHDHNRLDDVKSVAILRVSENLKHIAKVQETLKK